MRLGNQSIAMLVLGVLAVLLSILLAATVHFRHFYELLILGQFVALYGLSRTGLYGRIYADLYIVFAGAGVIADLVMGRHIGRFWHYNQFGPTDYIILYTFTYPMAGIVMVQSFVVAKALFLKVKDSPNWNPALTQQQYAAIILFLAVVLAGTMATWLINPSQYMKAFDYVLAVLLAFLVMSFVTALNDHETVIDDIFRQPHGMLVILFAVTYFNAFLHKIPNVFAHEWTYTNYPFPTLGIFGIPMIALIAWPLLLLFPLSIYYWIRSYA